MFNWSSRISAFDISREDVDTITDDSTFRTMENNRDGYGCLHADKRNNRSVMT